MEGTEATAFTAGEAQPLCGLGSDSVNVLVLSPVKLKTTRESPASAAPMTQTAGSHYGDILLALRVRVSDGRGLGRGGKFDRPKLLTGLGVEGAEASIVGGADERQAAGGDDRPTKAGPARILLAYRQTVGHAQRRSPGDLAGIHIDGD